MITTVTANQLNDLVSELYNYALPEFEVCTDYSGKYMFGTDCIGFVTCNTTMILMALTAVLIYFEQKADESDEDYVYPLWTDLKVSTDSMGLDSIVYFPGWRVED